MWYKIIKLSAVAMLFTSSIMVFAAQPTEKSYSSVEYEYEPRDTFEEDCLEEGGYSNNSPINYQNSYYSEEEYNNKLNQNKQSSRYNQAWGQAQTQAFVGITGGPIVWGKALPFSLPRHPENHHSQEPLKFNNIVLPLSALSSYEGGLIIGYPLGKALTLEVEGLYNNITIAVPDLSDSINQLIPLDKRGMIDLGLALLNTSVSNIESYLKAKPNLNMMGGVVNLAWQFNLGKGVSPVIAVGAGLVKEKFSTGYGSSPSSLGTLGLITQAKVGVLCNLTESLIVRGDYAITYVANQVWSTTVEDKGGEKFKLPSILYHGPKLTLAMRLDI